jgi:hypothetical protein
LKAATTLSTLVDQMDLNWLYDNLQLLVDLYTQRPFFHSFFCDDAAALLPNINADVRLSAPVLREMYDVPENITYGLWNVSLLPYFSFASELTVHQPHPAMTTEPRRTNAGRAPTEVVL